MSTAETDDSQSVKETGGREIAQDATKDAWDRLPEETKCELTTALHKHIPNWMDIWLDAAGIRGFSAKSAARRPRAIRVRLDRVFFSMHRGDFAIHSILSFFFALNARRFRVSVEQFTTPAYAETISRMRDQYPADIAILDLFEALLVWRFPDGIPTGMVRGLIPPTFEISEDEFSQAVESQQRAARSPIFTLEALRRFGDRARQIISGAEGINEYTAKIPAQVSATPLAPRRNEKSPGAHFDLKFGRWVGEVRAFDLSFKEYAATLAEVPVPAGDSPLLIQLLEAFEAMGSEPRSTCEDVLLAGKRALDTVGQIMIQANDLNAHLAKHVERIRAIDTYLRRPPFVPSSTVPGSHLIELLNAQSEIELRCKEAEGAFAEALAAEKRSATADLQHFREDFNLQFLEPEAILELDSIQDELANVVSVEQWQRLDARRLALRASLENRPELKTVAGLADEALADDLRSARLIALAAGLLRRDRAIESLVLLTMMQEVTDFNGSDVSDFSKFVETLTTATTRAAGEDNLAVHWVDAIFQQSWLRQLQRSDVKEHSMLQLLGIAFAVQHHLRGTAHEIGILFALRLGSAFPRDEFPAFAQLFGAITQGGTPEIVPEQIASPMEQAEADLRKFFRRDERRVYLEGVAPGNEFYEMEQHCLLPTLENLAASVLALARAGNLGAARELLHERDADKIFIQVCREARIDAYESDYFVDKVLNPQMNGYVPRILAQIERCIEIAAREPTNNTTRVIQRELLDEISIIETANPAATTLCQRARDAMTTSAERLPVANSGQEILVELSANHAQAARLTAGFVARYCRSRISDPKQDDLGAMVEAIARPDANLVDSLRAAGCFKHAALIAQDEGTSGGAGDELNRLRDDTVRSLKDRWRQIRENPSQPFTSDTFDVALRHGCYPWLEAQFSEVDRQTQAQRQSESEERSRWLQDQLSLVHQLESDVAADTRSGEDWRETVLRRSGFLARRLRLASGVDSRFFNTDEERAIVHRALEALDFVVTHRAHDLTEFQSHLTRLGHNEPPREEVAELSPEEVAPLRSRDIASAWSKLKDSKSEAREIGRDWQQFVHVFARTCHLRHDLFTTLNRLTSEQLPQWREYPFAVYATTFKIPRSRFLSREIRLYLCLGGAATRDQMELLAAECASDDFLHLVFVPTDFDKVRTTCGYDARSSNYLLLDERFLSRICNHAKPDVPLRQALHRSVRDLTLSKVFKSDGFVHEENDIFVGRQDALQRMAQQLWTVIWGGRRMGKTSLMHALKKRLEKMRPPWRVAFVYADSGIQGDPDLAIGQEIAHELSLPRPTNLEELHRLLLKERAKGRVAILLDEMDGYIEKSQRVHGDTFPLAKLLRSLTQTDSAQNVKLVYAGFKHLFYQCRMRSVSEPGYPFRQFLQPVDLDDLVADDVNELVKIGFGDMLGVEVEPAVPRLIMEMASGHPAFVQRFCERLLARLNRDGSLARQSRLRCLTCRLSTTKAQKQPWVNRFSFT